MEGTHDFIDADGTAVSSSALPRTVQKIRNDEGSARHRGHTHTGSSKNTKRKSARPLSEIAVFPKQENEEEEVRQISEEDGAVKKGRVPVGRVSSSITSK